MTTTQSNPVASTNQSAQSAPTTDQIQFLNTLADGLGEKPFTSGYHQLSIAVQIIGGRAALELAQRALAAYNVGMLTLDGKQRTLGGCFFALFKQEATPEQLHQFYQLRYEARAARREHDGHDKSAPAPAATTTKQVAPAKPQINQKKPGPAAQPPQQKKPVGGQIKKPAPTVKAGQTEGKRKPMAPTGKHRKSGK